jgi:hypothetical protein
MIKSKHYYDRKETRKEAMQRIYLLFIFVILTSCAWFAACATQVTMKKCIVKAEEEDLWTCPDAIQGTYRDCEPPKHLYHCVDPE